MQPAISDCYQGVVVNVLFPGAWWWDHCALVWIYTFLIILFSIVWTYCFNLCIFLSHRGLHVDIWTVTVIQRCRGAADSNTPLVESWSGFGVTHRTGAVSQGTISKPLLWFDTVQNMCTLPLHQSNGFPLYLPQNRPELYFRSKTLAVDLSLILLRVIWPVCLHIC